MIEISLKDDAPIIVKLINNEVYLDMTSNSIDEGFVLSFRQLSNTRKNIDNEEDIKEVNREKNNFLIKLTNDFKSPLQSIVGFSQAMADGLGGKMTDQQEKYIKIIRKNSQDLMYFIGKLLELSQTEIDIKTNENRTFDIINTVNTIIRYNEQLYKDKDVRWILNIDENLKNTMITDEDIIKNILQNVFEVVLNSVDMGEISLSIVKPTEEFLSSKNLSEGDYVMFSLSSSALLLSENDLESMFDPYKIIDTSNRKNLLRAIILSSVKNLVQSLNGIIWVESQILKNTSFNILIPQARN